MTERSSPRRIKTYIRNRLLLLGVFTVLIVLFRWIDVFGWIPSVGWIGSSHWREFGVLLIAALTTLVWIIAGAFGLIRLYHWVQESYSSH